MSQMDRADRNRTQPGSLNAKREALWSLLFLLIAAGTIWAVSSQSKSFSLAGFMDFLQGASLPWLVLAFGCMLLSVWSEGMALLQICRGFGHRRRGTDGFVYASADVYFSAITPSATGGQPASAFFMMRDGIPGPVSTVALLLNLIMYTLSIVVIGILCFLFRPGVYRMFSPLARLMILIGCAVQCGLVLLLLLLLKKEKLLHRACDAVLRFLAKLRLLRRLEKKRERLRTAIDDYRRNVQLASGQGSMLWRAFALNLMQRMLLIAVTMCAFRAAGGAAGQMLDAWAVQGFSILGYSFVPIPGAMGVADLMLMDGFGQMMAQESAVNLELLSRSISFYSCILICGAAVLVKYLMQKVRKQA